MPDILIRGLEPETIRQLKARAKRHGRSLQSEAKIAGRTGGRGGGQHVAAMLDRWQRHFAGRRFSGSARLIREDRKR